MNKKNVGAALIVLGAVLLVLNFIPFARGVKLSCVAGREYRQTQLGLPIAYETRSILPDKCGPYDETYYLNQRSMSQVQITQLKKNKVFPGAIVADTLILITLVSAGFTLYHKGGRA